MGIDCVVDWRECPTVRGRRLIVPPNQQEMYKVPMPGEQTTLAS